MWVYWGVRMGPGRQREWWRQVVQGAAGSAVAAACTGTSRHAATLAARAAPHQLTLSFCQSMVYVLCAFTLVTMPQWEGPLNLPSIQVLVHTQPGPGPGWALMNSKSISSWSTLALEGSLVICSGRGWVGAGAGKSAGRQVRGAGAAGCGEGVMRSRGVLRKSRVRAGGGAPWAVW
jgi:hypothetical protein